MIYLRSCPRCKGDIYPNKDIYGAYKECLQCGYIEDIADEGAYSRLHAVLDHLTRGDKKEVA